MGHQQHLLIVLGVIITGAAIVGGIQIFLPSAEQNNIDQTCVELLHLIDRAQGYYMKPEAMGGGGKSFTGFSISADLDTTENAYYQVVAATSERLVLLATCRIAEDATVVAYVYPGGHQMVVDRQYRERIGC